MVEFVESTSVSEKFLDGNEDESINSNSLTKDESKIVEVTENEVDAKSEENKIAAYIRCRMEPINELVDSERNYVERLHLVSEKYIPLLQDETVSIPEDLGNKWRIIWGNWLQLDAWHSSFLEKLENLIITDPDAIPKLLLDSRAKLRTIYSKYCENHRKATVIADQYREFFDERRIAVGDKQDMVSHLMQPVQRIMRYQLPMGLIVKLTKRAGLASLEQWERALDVMKEIPRDTQLILEAARIDGFPHSITTLGNIRMRGPLMIAISTQSDLEQQLRWSASCSSNMALSSGGTGSGGGGGGGGGSNATGSNVLSSGNSSNVGLTAPNNAAAAGSSTTSASNFPSNGSGDQSANTASSNNTSGSGGAVSLDDLKFMERRVFLFDQMLLITEEVRQKRKDPFAQSTYLYKTSINVNKMKFHSHWSGTPLNNIRTGSNSAQSGASSNSANQSSSFNSVLNNSSNDSASGSNCKQQQQHELIFMISDVTRGRDKVYIIDPVTPEVREQWVVQLRDIQRMQYDFSLALQDPKRFASKVDSNNATDCTITASSSSSSGAGGGGSAPATAAVSSGCSSSSVTLLAPTTESKTLGSGNSNVDNASSLGSQHHKKSKQKWPTFSGVANRSGAVIKKHLRPKAATTSITPPSSATLSTTTGTSSSGTTVSGGGGGSNATSDTEEENKSTSESTSSVTGVGGEGNPGTTVSSRSNVAVGGVGVLNDEDSATIKQRAWSAFSFRLRRSKRDQKIAGSHCYSKSDELGVIPGGNSPHKTVLGLVSPSPGMTAATAAQQANNSNNNNNNSHGSGGSSHHHHSHHKKRGTGNIFQNMFASSRSKNKHHQQQQQQQQLSSPSDTIISNTNSSSKIPAQDDNE